jgi:hypothetical protein
MEKNDVLIIGIAKFGCEIVKIVAEKIANVKYICISTSADELANLPKDIMTLHLPQSDVSASYENSSSREKFFNKMKELLHGYLVILVAEEFGTFATRIISKEIIRTAFENQVIPILATTLPFKWDGSQKNIKTVTFLRSIRYLICGLLYMDNELLIQKTYGDETLFQFIEYIYRRMASFILSFLTILQNDKYSGQLTKLIELSKDTPLPSTVFRYAEAAADNPDSVLIAAMRLRFDIECNGNIFPNDEIVLLWSANQLTTNQIATVKEQIADYHSPRRGFKFCLSESRDQSNQLQIAVLSIWDGQEFFSRHLTVKIIVNRPPGLS